MTDQNKLPEASTKFIELRDITISFVPIDAELKTKVADRLGTTVERVNAYLEGKEQNPDMLAAFLFFGVGPMNKLPSPRAEPGVCFCPEGMLCVDCREARLGKASS